MGFLLCVRAWEEGAGQLADARAMRLVVRVKVSSIESGRDGCATRRCRRFARVRARAQATRAQATRARARAYAYATFTAERHARVNIFISCVSAKLL